MIQNMLSQGILLYLRLKNILLTISLDPMDNMTNTSPETDEHIKPLVQFAYDVAMVIGIGGVVISVIWFAIKLTGKSKSREEAKEGIIWKFAIAFVLFSFVGLVGLFYNMAADVNYP